MSGMIVNKISKEDWEFISKESYLLVMEENREIEFDRIDYALITTKHPENKLMGFVTCLELDKDTVYWQYGGSYLDFRFSRYLFEGYKMMIEYCMDKYKRITTLIENTNKVMLKMASKAGFVITGIRLSKGRVLLEHVLEFGGA